jgi:hypothetical protein
MVDKTSRYYMKSSYENKTYTDKNSTTVERNFHIEGNDRAYVRNCASWIESDVMP